MTRFGNAAAAVALLSILFAATFPQPNNIIYAAINNSLTKIKGETRIIRETDRLQAVNLSRSVQEGDGSDDLLQGKVLSSRGPRQDSGESTTQSTLARANPAALPTHTHVPELFGTSADDGLDQALLQPTPVPAQADQTLVVATTAAQTQTSPPPDVSPMHIALQAGHWKTKDAPWPLNTMTGTAGGGKTEPEVTLSIATEAAKILSSWGHVVDILPTVIPLGYKADLVVAIHADGSPRSDPRGFFTDRPVGSPVAAAESRLSSAIDREYAIATGIPYVNRSTEDSRYYYGYRQVAKEVPMVLIETGFMTNILDQQIIIKQPEKSAQGIANGIEKYLGQ